MITVTDELAAAILADLDKGQTLLVLVKKYNLCFEQVWGLCHQRGHSFTTWDDKHFGGTYTVCEYCEFEQPCALTGVGS